MKIGNAGEGLPLHEYLFIRLLIPMARIFFTWKLSFWLFKREIKIIKSLVKPHSHQKLQHIIVTPKPFGVEDHSRQFSVNMVLEHLEITGRKVHQVIEALSQERGFEEKLTIECVKPHENPEDALLRLLTFVQTYETFFLSMNTKGSKATQHHPWFSSFNNFDWHTFLYMHTFIHRRQIEGILKALKERE